MVHIEHGIREIMNSGKLDLSTEAGFEISIRPYAMAIASNTCSTIIWKTSVGKLVSIGLPVR